MNEKNDLDNLKNTINNMTDRISNMIAATNTDAVQNALKVATSNLSSSFVSANLASNQIAIKNMTDGISSMITATNTDAVQNALKIATSNLSSSFVSANLASNQIAIKNMTDGISSMITATNTDAVQNALKIATSNLSSSFVSANLASNQIAIKNMTDGISSMITATNTDAVQNALKIATSNLSSSFASANLASNQIAVNNMVDRMSSMITATKAINNVTVTTPNMTKLIGLINNYSDIILEFDWLNFNLTEKNIDQSYKLIEDEYAEENISKELDIIQKGQRIKNSIYSGIVMFALIINFFSDFITVIQYTEQTIYPAVQSLSKHVFDSDKVAIKWLNNEIKQDVSTQLSNNFRIVTKDELIVREGKKVDSRINGKLNSTDVVQIIEKKKNWTYISYSNFEDREYIEGWVFTKYLKQIK